jgi:hypothetical protein
MALSLACKSLPGTLRCGASKALRARGSPPSHSILLDLDPSQMVQGLGGLQVDDQFELHILLDWQVRGVRLRQYGTTAVLRVTEEG